MKQAYKSIRYNTATHNLISFIDKMVAGYQAAGYMLSVRQIYYQLVARAMVSNTERSYKRVADTINNGRLTGHLDWDAIEDRGRDIVQRASWNSGASLLRACAQQYHMDMWHDQPRRIFIIVEKAALAGVLERPAKMYDVPLLAAKGYPSVSIVRELAVNYLLPATQAGQECLILHFGDHDPSGLDMTRDIDERIELFMGDDSGMVEIRRLALNMAQVEQYKPPPNPAKVTDSRFENYAKQFGDESWELDALEPSVLTQLAVDHIEGEVDQEKWEDRKEEIDAVKEKLLVVAKDF